MDGREAGGRPLHRKPNGDAQQTGWTGYDCSVPICVQVIMRKQEQSTTIAGALLLGQCTPAHLEPHFTNDGSSNPPPPFRALAPFALLASTHSEHGAALSGVISNAMQAMIFVFESFLELRISTFRIRSMAALFQGKVIFERCAAARCNLLSYSVIALSLSLSLSYFV